MSNASMENDKYVTFNSQDDDFEWLLNLYKPDCFNRFEERNIISNNSLPKHLYSYLPVHGWDKPMKQNCLMHMEFTCTMTFLPKRASFKDLGLTLARVPLATDYFNSVRYSKTAVMNSRCVYTNS